jgi:hypothetical protein
MDPNDRFLFMFAAFTSIAIIQLAIILGPRVARFQQTIAVGRLSMKLHSIIVAAITLLIILVIGSQIWRLTLTGLADALHIHTVTDFFAILLGAIFGSFTARFVSSLFSRRFGTRDPIIGVCVLLLLAIGYCFPLYSDALSDLIGGIGLSTVKTPFLELTLNKERGGKSFTYSASGSSSHPGQVPRPSDPVPGLKWLSLDTAFSADSAKSDDDYITFLNGTLPSDEDYIRFFDHEIISYSAHKQDVEQVIKLLAPATVLSTCLHEYISVFPDSGLLLVDVKPVIESLFMLHARAKNAKTSEVHYSEQEAKHLVDAINAVLKQVNRKFQDLELAKADLPECKSEMLIGAGEIDYRQPYTALVLADLIHAHGSPDEAIAILAEWLDMDSYRSKTGEKAEKEKISKWWRVRVMSRITLLMAEVAGQNNLAYRDFLDAYNKEMENYFEKGNITLRSLPAKCKWPARHVMKLAREVANARREVAGARREVASASQEVASARSTESASSESELLLNHLVEEKSFYLLIDAEDESLRTETNFISDEVRITALESLYARAVFLASIGKECLPGYFSERQIKGTIADYQVTVGLLELTVADRMETVAVSRADHARSVDIARDGEKALRVGYPILNLLVEEDRRNLHQLDWQKRVFGQSDWEKSASMAARAFLRLK